MAPYPRRVSEGQQWICYEGGNFLNAEGAWHLFTWLDSRGYTAAGKPNPYTVASSVRFEHGERPALRTVTSDH